MLGFGGLILSTVTPKCSCSTCTCRLGGPWQTSSSTVLPSRPWSGVPWTRACSLPQELTTSSASGICLWSHVMWVPGWRGLRTYPLNYCSCTRVSPRSRRSTGTHRYLVWWSPRLFQVSTCSGQYLCSVCVCVCVSLREKQMIFAFTWVVHI